MPTAVITWQPLMSDKPSFAFSSRGFTPFNFPPQTSPSPIKAKVRCESGARSPLAPTLPWLGIIGITSAFKNSIIFSTTSTRTPLCPRAKVFARKIIIPFDCSRVNGSPMPTECERIRFFCNCSISESEMRTEEKAPKPVLTPYMTSPVLIRPSI